eukprot:5048100-Karenia_brevis.AAC.1
MQRKVVSNCEIAMPAHYLLRALEYRHRAYYQSGEFAVNLYVLSMSHHSVLQMDWCPPSRLGMKRFIGWGCCEF